MCARVLVRLFSTCVLLRRLNGPVSPFVFAVRERFASVRRGAPPLSAHVSTPGRDGKRTLSRASDDASSVGNSPVPDSPALTNAVSTSSTLSGTASFGSAPRTLQRHKDFVMVSVLPACCRRSSRRTRRSSHSMMVQGCHGASVPIRAVWTIYAVR